MKRLQPRGELKGVGSGGQAVTGREKQHSRSHRIEIAMNPATTGSVKTTTMNVDLEDHASADQAMIVSDADTTEEEAEYVLEGNRQYHVGMLHNETSKCSEYEVQNVREEADLKSEEIKHFDKAKTRGETQAVNSDVAAEDDKKSTGRSNLTNMLNICELPLTM